MPRHRLDSPLTSELERQAWRLPSSDFQHVRLRANAATLRPAIPILAFPCTRNRPHSIPSNAGKGRDGVATGFQPTRWFLRHGRTDAQILFDGAYWMRAATLALLLAVTGAPVHAQTVATTAPAVPPASAITDMDAVVVSGVQPGPGMWKVSSGGHVLWVLGVQSPLPKDMQWHSPDVETAIAHSQEVLDQPGLRIGISAGGIFRAMFALPTLLKVQKLPDDKTLQDVLPPDLYLRWSQLKPGNLANKKQDVERWRPVFAAQALYDGAIHQAGLENGAVATAVAKLAETHKVRVTSTSLSALITKPKAMAKSFARTPLDEVDCFRATLDRLDSDVATTVARANAWAVGDVGEMARLTRRNDMQACIKTISEAEVMRSLGLDQAEGRMEAKWLEAAESALARNPSSFAMLSVPHLLGASSYLARLQAKGYVVEAPQ